ncbi:hypothetical protein [Pukyongiella litopenaei]|uniref:Uncharacterized protein n=1 Tax=Pukyongiella litopenaei TaxID=2605946 RepID=A0A2S0MTV4_9RHOB|nr:hypothetical protein [Pukyongiella litopenaei]AVO39326.1 hypothetical protein C6Y53_17570 [Pukyongiella litopenaei]
MSGAAVWPSLGDLWPYSEAAAPPELAALPLDLFLTDPKSSRITAALWVPGADPAAAPRAAYALRLMTTSGQGELARWQPETGTWQPCHRFPVPDGPDGPDGPDRCSIIELRGVLLGGVSDAEGLAARLNVLLQAEATEAKSYRISSKILSVASIIVLFFAVRSGVESNALEPFALIFALAVGIGLLAAGLRNRCKILAEQGLARMTEQFRFEYRADQHDPLGLRDLTAILKDNDRKREEDAVIFAFLLLLCFVYFISPLVVIGVIVAVIIVVLMIGDPDAFRVLGIAHDRAETRLEQAFLSLRAGDDVLTPPALRTAKKSVFRDRARRFGDLSARVRRTQARLRLTQDMALAVAFLVIFSAYAFPIAAGFQKLSIATADSLVSVSLFSVAPVIILLSISKSAVALALILSRRIAAMGKG